MSGGIFSEALFGVMRLRFTKFQRNGDLKVVD